MYSITSALLPFFSYDRVSVTGTLSAGPTEGAITMVSLYVPAANPLVLTLIVRPVFVPALRLPEAGEIPNQDCDAHPDQLIVLPPVFVSVRV